MADIVGLVLPFFGMIFLGALAARITRQPLEALGWMNTFIIYVALPALFFQLLARTPIEELTEWRYIAGVVLSTYLVFGLMLLVSLLASGGGLAEGTIKGLAAAYGNIGYMGPGLALLAFGPEAAVPVALIFCFENMLHFAVAPTMMALAGGEFAMGVTLALRPLQRVPRELGLIAGLKLIVHPILCYVILSAIGNFSEVWVFSAVLLAGLPTATNVFVLAQQYGVWVQRASASVLITTMLSVVTVTALLYLIRNGILPPDLFP